MANGILVNSASFGQSKAFIFTLTFTTETWQQFWRCLMVGCVMSDHLMNTPRADLAKTWNTLSTEVASLLIQGRVGPLEDEMPSSH
jgi:hypothetical protein